MTEVSRLSAVRFSSQIVPVRAYVAVGETSIGIKHLMEAEGELWVFESSAVV